MEKLKMQTTDTVFEDIRRIGAMSQTAWRELAHECNALNSNTIRHDFKSLNPTTRWSDIIHLK